jgi:tRNA dimethylallyltransferase
LVDPEATERLVLIPETAELHRRIAARADAMVTAGGMGEARALGELGLDPAMPAMKAIGVREFLAHLAGDLSLEEAVATIKTETRRYAKRQRTWIRNQMAGWTWLPG